VIPRGAAEPERHGVPADLPGAERAFQGNTNFFQVRPNPQNQRKDTVRSTTTRRRTRCSVPPLQLQLHGAGQLPRRLRLRHHGLVASQQDRQPRPHLDARPDDDQRVPGVGLGRPRVHRYRPAKASATCVRARDQLPVPVPRAQGDLRQGADHRDPERWARSTAARTRPPPPARSTRSRTTSRRSPATTRFKFGALFERSGQNDFDQINVSGVPGGTNNQNGRFEFNDVRPGGAPGTGTGMAQRRDGPVLDLRRNRSARLHAVPRTCSSSSARTPGA
jgi:hypothetical protein